jgi:hypothetical protein
MSQADPFRDIVKQNAKLYRDAEEAREINATKGAIEYAKWKREHEVYVRAAKCFAIGSDLDLKQIGIYDETPLQKVVDSANGTN